MTDSPNPNSFNLFKIRVVLCWVIYKLMRGGHDSGMVMTRDSLNIWKTV